jgi:hypothetical protein
MIPDATLSAKRGDEVVAESAGPDAESGVVVRPLTPAHVRGCYRREKEPVWRAMRGCVTAARMEDLQIERKEK